MKYNEDVMEVHNEFMTAGDTMLKQAEEILSKKVKINPAKIERLKSFGFKSSKDNTAIEDDKKEKSHQQKLVEAICDYRIKFPNHKFIPQEKVKTICEKYGLVSGEAHQYKGFVPDKNLVEIERFFEVYPGTKNTYWRKSKLGDGMISYVTGDIQISKEEYDDLVAKNTRREEEVFAKDKLDKSIEKFMGGSRTDNPRALTKHTQSFGRGMDMDIPAKSIFTDPVTDYWMRPHLYSAGIDPYGIDNSFGGMFLKPSRSGRNVYDEELANMYAYYGLGATREDIADRFYTKDVKLRICAPISEMNTSGYELRDGYKLVYDPIVSIEVTHKNGIKGEIILTAWGDEASDELVVDQNKN